MPSTTCSGIPSNRAPNNKGKPAAAAPERPPIRSTPRSPRKKASAPAASPSATGPPPAARSPSSTNSNETLEMSAPAPKPRTAPIRRESHCRATPSSAPMTREEAATAPHSSADNTSRTIAASASRPRFDKLSAHCRYSSTRWFAWRSYAAKASSMVASICSLGACRPASECHVRAQPSPLIALQRAENWPVICHYLIKLCGPGPHTGSRCDSYQCRSSAAGARRAGSACSSCPHRDRSRP